MIGDQLALGATQLPCRGPRQGLAAWTVASRTGGGRLLISPRQLSVDRRFVDALSVQTLAQIPQGSVDQVPGLGFAPPEQAADFVGGQALEVQRHGSPPIDAEAPKDIMALFDELPRRGNLFGTFTGVCTQLDPSVSVRVQLIECRFAPRFCTPNCVDRRRGRDPIQVRRGRGDFPPTGHRPPDAEIRLLRDVVRVGRQVARAEAAERRTQQPAILLHDSVESLFRARVSLEGQVPFHGLAVMSIGSVSP